MNTRASKVGPGSATDRTSGYPRLICLLILGVSLTSWGSAAASEVGHRNEESRQTRAPFSFERYEIVTGPPQRQTVLTGFLLGGAVADLAVVSIDDQQERRLRIYAFDDDNWVEQLDTTLRPDVLFVDVANVGGRDRLVTYERGLLNWFDPETTSERTLVATTADFEAPRSGEIPHVDITRDVNADDRDDLVVPEVNGFQVFVQTSDGGFADPVRLTSSGTGRTIEAPGYRHDPWVEGRVHEMDWDRDGRGDLVFWNEDHFEVYRQDESGLFARVDTSFTTDVVFDSDDPASIAAPLGFRHRRRDHMPTGEMNGRVLHSLTDVNGDGVADLVVLSLQVKNVFSAYSTYEVHFGSPARDGGTVFSRDVGTEIRSNGLPVGMLPRDLDRDGQLDLMFTTIEIGVSKTLGLFIGAILMGSAPLTLEVYSLEGGVYSDKPNATRKTRVVSQGKSGERSVFPSVLVGDVNGDGRSDLLMQKGRDELRVFLGVPGPELFARRPHKVAVDLPNEEYTWLVDINRDGKQDVLLHHHSSTPARLTMLVAQ